MNDRVISEPRLIRDILSELDLGNSVAEQDAALERYFVETETFRVLVEGKKDIIAGDKGTGKTALYRILQQRHDVLPELKNVQLISGFNPDGNPVFQRLAEGEPMDEGQYITVWKAYILSLVGNSILSAWEDAPTESMFELAELLERVGLKSADSTPNAIFNQVVNLFRRLMNPISAEMAISVGPTGMPVIAPRVTFADPSAVREPVIVEHDTALALLNKVLQEIDTTVWLALDRLDEAFAGFLAAEIPALRALLRSYLDLNAYERIKLKLFVRKDLFRRIIAGGFVNLTHINASKVEIVWDDPDLFDLLYRRIAESEDFVASLSLAGSSADEAFASVFPEKVDPGKRKPRTWPWMLSRIRDGNDIKPPRNLIDLVLKSQEAQARAEARNPREYVIGAAIISSDSIKRGLQALSNERVQDTLLAEAGDYAPVIERFRNGKAEHNADSLASLGNSLDEIKVLREIGFLEALGDTLKVPMLYRDGLNITQGKAFEDDEIGGAEGSDDDAADED